MDRQEVDVMCTDQDDEVADGFWIQEDVEQLQV